MHIQLTDVLTCPRCGPEFGLILLADRMEDRQVLDGALGCANCRERYPIVGGLADLRPPPAPPLPGPDAAPAPETGEAALRLAALLGVGEGRGFTAVVGPCARMAPGIVALADGIEVVAVDAALAGWAEAPGVNRIAAARRLPFRDHTVRAVAWTEGSSVPLEECARIVAPPGRLVLDGAPEDAPSRLAAAGLDIEAREGRTVLAVRRTLTRIRVSGR